MPSEPTGTQPSGWDSVPPGATTAAGWSVAAAQRRSGVPTASSLQQCGGGLGIRTPSMAVRHRAWPSAGRSASELASQRLSEGLPNPRVYSRAPPKIRKVPVNGVSQRRRPRPVRRTGVRLDCNRACPRAVGGLLFRADFRGLPQGHRSSSRQQRQMSTVAPAISVFEPPSRPSDPAAWPSASRSASPSASQRPPEGLPNPRVYSRLPPEKVPKGGVSLRRRPRPVRLNCNRACRRAVVGSAVPSRLPRPATGPPVEFAPAAAAGAPPRRRSRHSDPSTTVRHRRLAVSGPFGVTVGPSAAP